MLNQKYTTVFSTFMQLLIFSTCQAQDSKNINKFKINNTVTIGMAKSQVIQSLGTPTLSSAYYFELNEINGEVLYYEGSPLFFIDDELYSYQINDSSLFLQYENTVIQLGNNASLLQNVFPQSWNKRFLVYGGPTISIDLFSVVNGQTILLSESVGISFDSGNNLITKIAHENH